MKFTGMTIGIPTENMNAERRVSATPETVKKMVAEGATVLVQKGAGAGAFFPDEEYVAAGAKIVEKAGDIFDQADVILKVKEPQFNKDYNKNEAEMLKKGQVLITFLHPATPCNHETVKMMAKSGATTLTLDGIPRISRAQSMDALSSMSTCAGYRAVLMAALNLPKFLPMIGTAVGMIKPSNVTVIGTGVAGLQAVATAKRLGAVVTAIDIRPAAAEQATSLGAKTVDTTVPADIAMAEGGYAQKLPEEWLLKEREAIKDTIINSDIVICTALIPSQVAPILVTEEMIKQMKPGSCIVDVAVDQGGNCELTEHGHTVVKHGVTIDGTQNIPGQLPTSSTWMFAHNIYNLLAYLAKDGKIELDRNDEIVAKTLTTIDGEIVHAGAKQAMGL